MLAERGAEVDHVTVYRWVRRFAPLFADAARPCRHAAGDRWFVDETYVKVAGRWRYLYRAVDQHGQVIDVLLTEQGATTSNARAERLGSAAVIAAGHAFIQNLHRGHYELATDAAPSDRLAAAFTELALAI